VDLRVTPDAKGNPVLEVRVTSPRRRSDDDTVDQLECLDADALSLESGESGDVHDGVGFDPYGRSFTRR
jgi:hypothetical protein